MTKKEIIITNIGLMLLSLSRDWLSMCFAFILSEKGYDIKTVCLFAFVYSLGNLFSVFNKQEQYNKAINCFYFLIIITLLQQSILSIKGLLIIRMLQGFCFAAVIYSIQELIFFFNKEEQINEQKQTQKIYVTNITIVPLIARYSGFFLRYRGFNILSFVVISLIICHFCVFSVIKNYNNVNDLIKNQETSILDLNNIEKKPSYNQKIILFYFFICSAVRSSLFFLVYSLKQAKFSDSYIGKVLCFFTLGEIMSRVVFETKRENPETLITYLLILFSGVLGVFLFQIITKTTDFLFFVCILIGFIQGKISDLTFLVCNNIINNISTKNDYVMRIVSNFSFVMAPFLFLPTMYFFTPIVGIILSRIILSILAAIVLNI